MTGFTTELNLSLAPGREDVWELTSPLVFVSKYLGEITVPAPFFTDLSSVPRVPFVFWWWGGRAHREGVLHDFLYREDSQPKVSFSMANKVFLEAMKARGKPWYVRGPMYAGVVAGGILSYHKKSRYAFWTWQ